MTTPRKRVITRPIRTICRSVAAGLIRRRYTSVVNAPAYTLSSVVAVLAVAELMAAIIRPIMPAGSTYWHAST